MLRYKILLGWRTVFATPNLLCEFSVSNVSIMLKYSLCPCCSCLSSRALRSARPQWHPPQNSHWSQWWQVTFPWTVPRLWTTYVLKHVLGLTQTDHWVVWCTPRWESEQCQGDDPFSSRFTAFHPTCWAGSLQPPVLLITSAPFSSCQTPWGSSMEGFSLPSKFLSPLPSFPSLAQSDKLLSFS